MATGDTGRSSAFEHVPQRSDSGGQEVANARGTATSDHVVYGQPAEAARLREGTSQQPAGIGGWLLYFVLGAVGGLVVVAVDLVTLLGVVRAGVVGEVASDVATIVSIDVLWATGLICGLVLILLRWRRAPAYWTLFLVANIALSMMYPIAVQMLKEAVYHLPYKDPDAQLTGTMGRGILLSVVWIFYWCRSKRVLNTFGTRGLGRPQGTPRA